LSIQELETPLSSEPAGLTVGLPAPAFELPDLNGQRKALSDFLGHRLLLIFFNPGCGFCVRMAPELARLPSDGADGQPIPLVVSVGTAAKNRKFMGEHGIQCPVLLQPPRRRGAGGGVASLYHCHGTPMGYLIDEQGRIASEIAVGLNALLALVGVTLPEPSHEGDDAKALGGRRGLEDSKLQRNGLEAGAEAPDFRLPLLNGGELSLSEYRGRQVLLVFSDPHCGPCDHLAPRLQRRARSTPEVQVLMISRGDPDDNQAKVKQHRLAFPIALQRKWEISRKYAMFSTPIAYLINEKGVVSAPVAVGPRPILSLLSPGAKYYWIQEHLDEFKPVGEWLPASSG
jgi:peroxiredoxin